MGLFRPIPHKCHLHFFLRQAGYSQQYLFQALSKTVEPGIDQVEFFFVKAVV